MRAPSRPRLGCRAPCDPPSPHLAAVVGRCSRPRGLGALLVLGHRRSPNAITPESGGSPNADAIQHALQDRARTSRSSCSSASRARCSVPRQVPGAQGRGRGPDPRQHAPRDRLDGRRGADPRRAHRRDLHQARRHHEPAARAARTGCRPRLGAHWPRPRTPPKPPGGKALHICVDGQQYIWRYTYAPQRQRLAAYSYEEMVVPVDTTVSSRSSRPTSPLVVDPEARRQDRRDPGLPQLHVVQGPSRPGHLHRPVRRAVRAQPREHDRARQGRDRRPVHRPGSPARSSSSPRPTRGPAAAPAAAQAAPAETPLEPMIATTADPATLRPAPQVAAHEVARPRTRRLDRLGDHDRPQEDRDHVHGHDLRLLPAGRGRGAAHAHPARGRRTTPS